MVDQDFWVPNKRRISFHQTGFSAASWSVAFSVKFVMKDLRNVSHPRVRPVPGPERSGAPLVELSSSARCCFCGLHVLDHRMRPAGVTCWQAAESGKQQRNLIPVTLLHRNSLLTPVLPEFSRVQFNDAHFEKLHWNKGWQYFFWRVVLSETNRLQWLFTTRLLPCNVYFCHLLLGFWYCTLRQTNLNAVCLCNVGVCVMR